MLAQDRRLIMLLPEAQCLHVRRAVASDAQALTDLVFRAKAHWGYPRVWMEAWRAELIVSSHYIELHRVILAEVDQQLAGFYGLEFRTDVAHLEHLWVEPTRIGSGLGRKLLGLACDDARANDYKVVELVADPNAERFYLRQGAARIGEVHGNVLGMPRVLPRMQLNLYSANNALQATCEDARA
jgi:N-acetylglutamate synthase-like GNAT family acetyltransferase